MWEHFLWDTQASSNRGSTVINTERQGSSNRGSTVINTSRVQGDGSLDILIR